MHRLKAFTHLSREPSHRWPGILPVLLLLVMTSCSGKPAESIFTENIDRMMLLDRELGFQEEISAVLVKKMIEHPDRTEVVVRVEGWAVHPEISIGAVLPVSRTRRQGWATWKFYCAKNGDTWEIREKYKVDEGFFE